MNPRVCSLSLVGFIALPLIIYQVPESMAQESSASSTEIKISVRHRALANISPYDKMDSVIYERNSIVIERYSDVDHVDIVIPREYVGDKNLNHVIRMSIGENSDYISLNPRSIHLGKKINIEIILPIVSAKNRNDIVENKCKRLTRKGVNYENIVKLMSCRAVFYSSIYEDKERFFALKGWYDAHYNIVTVPGSYIKVDQELVDLVERYKSNKRFGRIFGDIDRRKKEIREIYGAELLDAKLLIDNTNFKSLNDMGTLASALEELRDAVKVAEEKNAIDYGVTDAYLTVLEKKIRHAL